MRIVHIDKLKADMVLAEDVRDVNGRLLLAKKEQIQSNHIRIFKMWGISEVFVSGGNGRDGDPESSTEHSHEHSPEESPEDSIDTEMFDKISDQTRSCFKHKDLLHPAMKELFRLSVAFRYRHNIFEENIRIESADDGDQKTHILNHVRQKIFEKKIKLPEIPSIVVELNEVIANPYASANSIADVVKKSPSLTALLLRIVNSSFYGFPSQIDSISRAVMIIGTRELANLALGVSIISVFKDISKEVIDMSLFLRHSYMCGIISRGLGAHKNLPKTELLFVAGLLHDLGKLIIYQHFPQQAKVLLKKSMETGRFLHHEEMDCLGCRHTEVGKYLFQQWKLPVELENAVFFHHNPSLSSNAAYASIVHLADIIVNALRVGTSGERLVPALDRKAWDHLGLSPRSFKVVIDQASHQFEPFEAFLKR
jgi:HD-like signal output (HDOD) protein